MNLFLWCRLKRATVNTKRYGEDMRKLIVLRGNSGSGKTTVARMLQRKIGYNTMLISQDEIRRNMLGLKMA